MDIHRRRVDTLVVIERDRRCGRLLVHCDGAGGTSHTTVRTGNVKVDIVGAWLSRCECNIGCRKCLTVR